MFNVTITGNVSSKSYSVEFFDLYSVDKVDTYWRNSSNVFEPVSEDAAIESNVNRIQERIVFLPGFSDGLPSDPGLQSIALDARNAQEITYTSSDTTVATIEPFYPHNYTTTGPNNETVPADWSATVKPQGPGTATLTATLSNGLTKSVQFHVTASLNGATITGVEEKQWTGDAVTQTPTVTLNGKVLEKDKDYQLSYQNNTNVGWATMTVTGIGDCSGGKSVSFQITKADISAAQVTGLEERTFDGSAQTQSPVVTLNGKTLQANTDYTLSYDNNVNAGTDTATVTVTGMGNYTGSTSATFTILPATITSVSPQTPSFVYDGQEKKPAVTVMAGSITVPDSGYDVAYASNVNVGTNTATVTVTGKGNYSGSKSATFSITKAQSSVSAQAMSNTVTCTYSNDESHTFGTSNLSVSDAHGGVSYSNASTDTTAAKFEINAGTGCVTVPAKTPVGTYELRVSVSDAGDANCEGGTTYASYSVKVDPASIAGATLSEIPEQTYKGSGITPKPTVKLGELVLLEGTDFNFAYDKNVNAGTALIWVVGKGNYQGQSNSSQFSIGRKQVTVTANDASKEYGSKDPALTAKVSGTVGGDTVKYTLSREAGENVGSYAITSTGDADQSNYSVSFAGSVFTITQANISTAQIAPIEAQVRTGQEIKPRLVITHAGKTLIEDFDYGLSYANNIEVGTATVTVTGTGNFTGTATATFSIGAKRLQDMTVSLGKERYKASEIPARPSVRVVDPAAGTDLVEGKDYTVEYKENDKVGTAKVVLTGKGDCVGTVERTFEITKDPSALAASAAAGSVSCMSGSSIAPNVKVTGAIGNVRYANASTDATAKKFTVDGRTGGIGVPSNIAAGTYQMRVRVKDSGDGTHEAGEAHVSFAVTVKASKSFPDVPASAWYAGVVGRATALGLMSGYSNGKFGPADKVTRGQVAVILWNMTGSPEPGAGAKDFSDVKSNKYFYKAVRWASSTGVVSGYGNGKFGPNDNVTREQFAAMLANYARSVKGQSVTGSAADYASMKDKDKVSSWAVTSVGWCFRNKILTGSGSNVNPAGNTDRAEAAKMVVGLHDMLF